MWAPYALAQVTEWTMKVPLVSKAQVRMLAEGVTPDDLRPRRMFTAEQIRSALAEPGGFGWRDPADRRLSQDDAGAYLAAMVPES